MNNERAERNENIVHMIKIQYKYETEHTDAAANYSVLLDRDMDYRCTDIYFREHGKPLNHTALQFYAKIDLCYLGQTEMEIVIDDDMLRGIEFNEEDASYIEACVDATVNIGSYGVYAYMNYPEISVCATIDLEHDRAITENLEFNQELFQEILHGASLHRWCVEELVSGKKKEKGVRL